MPKLMRSIKKWGLSVAAVGLGGVFVFAMLALFNIQTQKTVEAVIHGSMEDMNRSATLAFRSNMDNFIALLEKQSELFSVVEQTTDDEILERLEDLAAARGIKNVAILTTDGKTYSSARGILDWRDEEKPPNLNAVGTTISQPRIFEDGTLVIDISTPVALKSGETGRLAISLGSDYIAGMFPDDILRGDAAFHLLAQDGTVIARTSQRQSELTAKANLFDFYGSAGVAFERGSAEELAAAMSRGKDAWVKYGDGQAHICVYHAPVGLQDWYLAIEATDATLNEQSQSIRHSALLLTLGIVLVLIFISIVVIIQRVGEQKRIDAIKNTYNIAIQKTNDLFYEADIENGMFVDYSEEKGKTVWKETPKNYSNALIQVAEVCAPECRQQFLDTFLPQNIRIKMKEGISSINFEYKIVPTEDTVRWLSATFVPVEDGSGGTKLICMENDITEEKLRQESLKKSAMLDGLTGLYNKVTTANSINWFLREEGSEGRHALLLIDVDHFKAVNDTLGHAKGDEVLAELAGALKRIFRRTDIVGRLGGDEFAVFMKDYGLEEMISEKVAETLRAFNKEHHLENGDGTAVRTTASIGIARFGRDGVSFEALYRAADVALYQAKEQGRNRFVFCVGADGQEV